MDACSLLKREHQKLKNSFSKYERIDAREGKKRMDAFKGIKKAIEFNFDLEEESFYPMLNSNSLEMDMLMFQALRDHEEIRNLLKDLSERYPFEKEFSGEMKLLSDRLRSHLSQEERKVFKKARELIPGESLKELGEDLEMKREELYLFDREALEINV